MNAVLGGMGFTKSPPSVMLKIHGRLIAVHPRRISINALQDAAEAEKIVEWLMRGINDAWANRHDITPKYEVAKRPQPLEITRMLPKTNCRECGQPDLPGLFFTCSARGRRPRGLSATGW